MQRVLLSDGKSEQNVPLSGVPCPLFAPDAHGGALIYGEQESQK